jgi:hypothetical protein
MGTPSNSSDESPEYLGINTEHACSEVVIDPLLFAAPRNTTPRSKNSAVRPLSIATEH